jgi:hypothetical protein
MDVTMKAIKESDYFVALVSTNSVLAKGPAQKQIETAWGFVTETQNIKKSSRDYARIA